MNLLRPAAWPLWIVLLAAVFLFDWVTPPSVLFMAAYAVVVSGAARHLGIRSGLAFGGFSSACLVTVEFVQTGHQWPILLANLGISLGSFVALAYMVHVIDDQRMRLAQRVQTLEGILPTCSFCKRVRGEDGRWEQMEGYISSRSKAMFSHGVCDECARKHFPEFAE